MRAVIHGAHPVIVCSISMSMPKFMAPCCRVWDHIELNLDYCTVKPWIYPNFCINMWMSKLVLKYSKLWSNQIRIAKLIEWNFLHVLTFWIMYHLQLNKEQEMQCPLILGLKIKGSFLLNLCERQSWNNILNYLR